MTEDLLSSAKSSKAQAKSVKARAKSRVGFVVLFVLGICGHILNLAGVADAIISWRAFFSLGLLRAYTIAKQQSFELVGLHVTAIVQDLIVAATCTAFIFAYALSGSWGSLLTLANNGKSRFHLWSLALYISMFFLGVTFWVFFLGGRAFEQPENWFEWFMLIFYPYVFSLLGPVGMFAITAEVVRGERGISLDQIPKRLALAMLLVTLGFIGLLFVAADLDGAI